LVYAHAYTFLHLPSQLFLFLLFFFFDATPPTAISTFPYTTLFRSAPPHGQRPARALPASTARAPSLDRADPKSPAAPSDHRRSRSEEHTSELQSPCNLVCRLLLQKKNTWKIPRYYIMTSTERLRA